MKTHQMKLQSRYFDYMKNGTKRIELRLYDEKRSQIEIGDEIDFSKAEVKAKARTEAGTGTEDKVEFKTGAEIGTRVEADAEVKARTETRIGTGAEILRTKVVGLLRYDSFENLFRDFDITILADASTTKAALLEALEEFYPLAKQKQYGVVGIRLEIV